VVNVITKPRRDINGAQGSVEVGSFGARTARASYGQRADNGNELLLSISSYRVAGQDFILSGVRYASQQQRRCARTRLRSRTQTFR